MTTRKRLGSTLRSLRKAREWTLSDLGKRSDVPVSTLSKIENNQLSPTYDQLLRLSEGLELDIAELFSAARTREPAPRIGRRSINRLKDGDVIQNDTEILCYLSTDLLNKAFTPIVSEVTARSIEDFGDLMRHPGEEFVYVISGRLELHTEFYAPVILEIGESAHFDSTMGHGYVALGETPCRFLSICSGPPRKPATP